MSCCQHTLDNTNIDVAGKGKNNFLDVLNPEHHTTLLGVVEEEEIESFGHAESIRMSNM